MQGIGPRYPHLARAAFSILLPTAVVDLHLPPELYRGSESLRQLHAHVASNAELFIQNPLQFLGFNPDQRRQLKHRASTELVSQACDLLVRYIVRLLILESHYETWVTNMLFFGDLKFGLIRSVRDCLKASDTDGIERSVPIASMSEFRDV